MNKLHNNIRGNYQSGLTLLEVLVAVTIFSLITIAIFTLYINSSRNYRQDEVTARMIENGRFALDFIGRDLVMADFWGEMLVPSAIDAGAFGTVDDCDANLLNFEAAILYYEDGGTVMESQESFEPADTAMTDFDPLNATNCDGAGNTIGGDISAGTNALVVKRVGNIPVTTRTAGTLYINTNGTEAELVEHDGGDATYNYWEYMPVMYVIRDDINAFGTVPMLCRIRLQSASTSPVRSVGDDLTFEPASDCLAEGVEHMHIEFGLDTDSDGVADVYVSNIDIDEAEQAISARVYLLMRSATPDPNPDYINEKLYTLGQYAVNDTDTDGTPDPFNDRYYRRVYNTTVTLRNPKAYNALNQ